MYPYNIKLIVRSASSIFLLICCLITPVKLVAQTDSQKPSAEITAIEKEIQTRAAAVEKKLIAWRRDIHEHPELGDFEKRTAALVAEHLKGLEMDVTAGVARTGVIGILKGGKPERLSHSVPIWMHCPLKSLRDCLSPQKLLHK